MQKKNRRIFFCQKTKTRKTFASNEVQITWKMDESFFAMNYLSQKWTNFYSRSSLSLSLSLSTLPSPFSFPLFWVEINISFCFAITLPKNGKSKYTIYLAKAIRLKNITFIISMSKGSYFDHVTFVLIYLDR